jgi:uncharacterized protein
MNKPLDLSIRTANRQIWAEARAAMETKGIKHMRNGTRKRRRWDLFNILIRLFGGFIKLTGGYPRGVRNAMNVVVNELTLSFDDLPMAFDNYKILHLTDLHLDSTPGIEEIISNLVKSLSYNLCVMTGDYRAATSGGFQKIIDPMEQIVRSLQPPDGIWATLGNHDSYLMADEFEQMGIGILANEKVLIQKGKQIIELTGVDDPHYYFSDQAQTILEQPSSHFKIALVHSPELYDIAEINGFRLYLCGHSHGGQICLPGGIPLVTHLSHGKRYYRGLWKTGRLMGYTSQGCGVVGLPVRFNTQSEITLLTLRRKSV